MPPSGCTAQQRQHARSAKTRIDGTGGQQAPRRPRLPPCGRAGTVFALFDIPLDSRLEASHACALHGHGLFAIEAKHGPAHRARTQIDPKHIGKTAGFHIHR